MSKFEKQLKWGSVTLARIKYRGNGKAVIVLVACRDGVVVRYTNSRSAFKVAYSALREF